MAIIALKRKLLVPVVWVVYTYPRTKLLFRLRLPPRMNGEPSGCSYPHSVLETVAEPATATEGDRSSNVPSVVADIARPPDNQICETCDTSCPRCVASLTHVRMLKCAHLDMHLLYNNHTILHNVSVADITTVTVDERIRNG